MYELLALQSALLNLNQEDSAWSILTSTKSGSFQLDFAQISANSAHNSNILSHRIWSKITITIQWHLYTMYKLQCKWAIFDIFHHFVEKLFSAGFTAWLIFKFCPILDFNLNARIICLKLVLTSFHFADCFFRTDSVGFPQNVQIWPNLNISFNIIYDTERYVEILAQSRYIFQQHI